MEEIGDKRLYITRWGERVRACLRACVLYNNTKLWSQFYIRHYIVYIGRSFNWWVSFAPEFQCCYFCESSCLFYLSFNFDFYVSKIMHL